MPYDVNDAAVRSRFLTEDMWLALHALAADAAPRWGQMRAQQMVEHLLWAFEVSLGRVPMTCYTPPEQVETYRRFLRSNRPAPPEFMNPALTEGLPPLQHPDLPTALAALRVQVDGFLATPADRPAGTHPVFGELDLEGWARAHDKHCHHHLAQFGLDMVPHIVARSPKPEAPR
jgi:oxepin-CoA hydrolase/3-oxo-5,6-dehydrosuberyl-CoA semialdehyde dehydrogenase